MRMAFDELHRSAPRAQESMRSRAAAFFSAFLLQSCLAGSQVLPRSATTPEESIQRQSAPAQVAPAPPHGTLVSLWERGRCTFERNTVSYYDVVSSEVNTLRLDVRMEGASALLCSGEFTVVIDDRRAAVAIGGNGTLAGQEMLGRISGRFVPANSYEVSLQRITSEDGGISSQNLSGGSLQLISMNGNRWSLDLADPYGGWNVTGRPERVF